jgi:outer membrane protein TolC
LLSFDFAVRRPSSQKGGKTVKNKILKVLTLGFVFSFVGSSLADEPFQVTPETLRKRLLTENISVLTGLNQLYQAKIQVNIARAQLLPSLNLGAALPSGKSNFIVSTVSFLLPFLVPSNWFNYDESQYLFDAEKDSYYLLQLNSFASAYSIYSTMVSDVELRKILNTQYENLVKIKNMIQAKYELGLAGQAELLQAQAQAELAMVQLSQIDELLLNEQSILRQSLAFPLEKDFNLVPGHVPPATVEGLSPQALLDVSLMKSPEYSQVQSLIAAAEDNNWAKVFAFINSGSLSSSSVNGASASFSSLTQTENFNFGFGYFPGVELSEAAVAQMKLRLTEVKSEQARIVESALSSLKQAQLQFQQAQSAEADLLKVFSFELENYELGLTDLQHVLDVQNSVTIAATTRAKSQLDLDGQRITLHRLIQTDEFANIKGCAIEQKQTRSFWQGIKDFFSSSKSQKTIEEICRS